MSNALKQTRTIVNAMKEAREVVSSARDAWLKGQGNVETLIAAQHKASRILIAASHQTPTIERSRT